MRLSFLSGLALAAAMAALTSTASAGDDPRQELRELELRVAKLEAMLKERELVLEKLQKRAAEEKEDLERRYEAACEEIERHRDESADEHRRWVQVLSSHEEQVTELRQRIHAIQEDSERLQAERFDLQRRMEKELRDARTRLETSSAALRLAEPLLRRLVESGSPEDRFEAAAALDAAELLDRESVAILSTFLGSDDPGERRQAFRFFMSRGRYGECWPAMVRLFHGEGATMQSRAESLALLLESGTRSLTATAREWAASLPPVERLAAGELAAARGFVFGLEIFAGLLLEEGDVAEKALENLRCATQEDFGGGPDGVERWKTYLLENGAPTIAAMVDCASARKAKAGLLVSLAVKEAPLEDVIDFLRDVCGIEIRVLTPLRTAAEVTIELEDEPLEKALEKAAAAAECAFAFRSGVYYLGLPDEIAALGSSGFVGRAISPEADPEEVAVILRLETRKVSIDFLDSPLTEVLEFIAAVTRSNLFFFGEGDEDEMMVQLMVDEIAASDALDLILSLKGLSRLARWGGLVIGDEETISSWRDIELPEEGPGADLTATLRSNSEDWDFTDKTLEKIFWYFSEAFGVIIEPAEGLALPEERLSLKGWDMTLEQTLNVLLVPRGLTVKVSEDGGRLIVCKG